MVLEPLKTDLRASEPTRSLYSNRTKSYFSRNSLPRPIFRQSLGFSIFPFCTPPGNIYGRPFSKNLKKKKNKKKRLNQASAENDYHDNCRAQWEVQTVTHCPGWGGSKSWYQGRT